MDALDTLLIMGMKEEFDKGREWVATNLDMSTMVSIACQVTRRSQRDVVYLGLPIVQSFMSPNAGGGGGDLGVKNQW